jgi:polyvinyl alcohol dehydrogenase (cytochrome)
MYVRSYTRKGVPFIRRLAGGLGLLLSATVYLAAQAPPPDADGEALYREHCAACHDGGDSRAPSRAALDHRSARTIVEALTSGTMRYQGLPLNGMERRAIAEFLTGDGGRSATALDDAKAGRCGRTPPFVVGPRAPAWNGWSPTIENTHFQPAAQAGLTAAQVPQLKLQWAFGFPDAAAAWSEATVVGGRVFVGSQNGIVYALDAQRGCVLWTFTAHAGVRASITVGRARNPQSKIPNPQSTVPNPQSPASSLSAFFSDQSGYVYAVDAGSGRLQWVRRVEEHPLVRLTGSPVLHAGRLYVPTSSYEEGGKPPGYGCCTFRGSLIALDAATGDVIWQRYTIPERSVLLREYADGTELWGPAGGAIWSAPTIDSKRRAIYAGVGNTYSGAAQKTTDAIVAFDLDTGAIRWVRQMNPGERDVFGCAPGDVNCGDRPGPDFDFGASPALATLPNGRQLIVAGQKSGVLYALDPDRKGAIVWRYRAGGGSGLGGIQWGVAADSAQAYAPVAEIYAEAPGGLHAVSLATGKRAWYAPPAPPACGKPSRACSGAQFSAVSVIPGVVFSPSNDGVVRAFDTQSGALVWSFDTNHEFETVNRVKAHGGSMNGPAPTIAGGMLFVSSGYGTFGLRPGNVLLAFGVDPR